MEQREGGEFPPKISAQLDASPAETATDIPARKPARQLDFSGGALTSASVVMTEHHQPQQISKPSHPSQPLQQPQLVKPRQLPKPPQLQPEMLFMAMQQPPPPPHPSARPVVCILLSATGRDMETTTVETSSSGAEGEAAHQPLTTAEEKRKMKLLVAMDESDGSFYALKWALDHIFCYPIQPDLEESNMITLVHVQPIFQPFIYPAGPVVYAAPAVIDAVKQAQAQNAAAILSRALHMCKEKKIKAETLILEGDPKDRICQAAEQLHVDLVVIGSRGLGTIKRAFLGSVSSYCAHHVHCPILIVKPPSKEAHE